MHMEEAKQPEYYHVQSIDEKPNGKWYQPF